MQLSDDVIESSGEQEQRRASNSLDLGTGGIGPLQDNRTSTDGSQDNTDLRRCAGVARTTNLQCKKRVSFLGEEFCPAHGGRQIKAPVTLPMCAAISKTTRQGCRNHVVFVGEQFCSHHGGGAGMAKRAVAAVARNAVPSQTGVTIGATIGAGEVLPNWTEMQSQCLVFLTETHPKSKCGCNALSEPCQGMKLVLWAQSLVALAQQQQQQQSASSNVSAASAPVSASIFEAKPGELTKFIPRKGTADPFGDLYAAVALFGSNILFLPRFFQHIQKEVPVQSATTAAVFAPWVARSNDNSNNDEVEREPTFF
jgi:hypothetical protein